MTAADWTFAAPRGERAGSGIDTWALALVVTVAAVAHGFNMFAYPYFENDEGTYMAQAWSMLHKGALAPYTYWYDHPPVGWAQLAALLSLTGAGQLVPQHIPTGRAFMLLYQVGSTALVYLITRKVTGRPWAGVLAALAFSLSAWGIYYHRRVLLDNIATFWMLAAFLALAEERLSLRRIWLAAVALAIAVLSKENLIFVAPAMLLLVALRTGGARRVIGAAGFTLLTGSLVSLYPLMALLRGEFFPSRSGEEQHVSLMCTLAFQTGRGKDGGILDPSSGFWVWVASWLREEPLLVGGGTLAAVACLLMIRRSPFAGSVGLATLLMWLFVGRGGVIADFYLLPLLPLLAMSLVFVFCAAADIWERHVGRADFVVPALAFAFMLPGTVAGYMGNPAKGAPALWQNREAMAHAEAVAWVRANLPQDTPLAIDMSMWSDLHETYALPSFTKAHYYWRGAADPAIRDGVFREDWRNIAYIVATPQLRYDAERAHMPMISDALRNSRTIATFDTGGWDVQVRQVDPAMGPVEDPADMPSEPLVNGPMPTCMTNSPTA